MKRMWLFIFVLVILSSCTSAITSETVISAFKNAGLEAENTSAMTKDDYGLAPYVCSGTRFLIPSIGESKGGRIFICENSSDRDLLFAYYEKLGKSSAMFFSWVFTKGNVLIQINGDMSEEIARKYESAIP